MVNYPKDWREINLGDSLNYTQPHKYISNVMKDKGKNPVLTAGKSFVLGYSNETNIYENIPVILFDDFTTEVRYIDFKFLVRSSATKFLSLKNEENNLRFLYYKLANLNYVIESHERHWIKKFAGFSMKVPKIEEQNKVVEVISYFDEHIENLEELIAKKKMIRDGAVEDLMSGKTRLDGFAGEWKTLQFQNVITPKARIGWQGLKKDEYLKKGFAYLISGTDFENGTISLNEISYVNKERYSMDANIQVKEGDVLVTKDGTIGKIARVPELNKKATLNSGVFVFRTNHLLEECFLYWILRSSIFGKFIDDLSAGSTIKHLYQKDLKNFSFTIPTDIKEQQAIADTLTAMDEEIETLREEKEKIEKLKVGAMDDLLTGKIRLVKEG